jgi:hypothetical protein
VSGSDPARGRMIPEVDIEGPPTSSLKSQSRPDNASSDGGCRPASRPNLAAASCQEGPHGSSGSRPPASDPGCALPALPATARSRGSDEPPGAGRGDRRWARVGHQAPGRAWSLGRGGATGMLSGQARAARLGGGVGRPAAPREHRPRRAVRACSMHGRVGTRSCARGASGSSASRGPRRRVAPGAVRGRGRGRRRSLASTPSAAGVREARTRWPTGRRHVVPPARWRSLPAWGRCGRIARGEARRRLGDRGAATGRPGGGTGSRTRAAPIDGPIRRQDDEVALPVERGLWARRRVTRVRPARSERSLGSPRS